MIISIDPGTMTGMVVLDRGTPHYKQVPHTEAGTIMLGARWDDVEAVVMERFIITSSTIKKSRAGMHDALNLIGLSYHLCMLHGIPFIGQTPAEGKRITKEQLQAADLWPKGMTHAQDAARHLYLYLAKMGQL